MSKVVDIHLAGTHAGRPAAASSNAGYLYFETDTGSLFRSDGSAWSQVAISDQSSNLTYLDATVAAAPGTPGTGKLRVYAKTGKVLAVKDDAGTETVLGAGGGGGTLAGDSDVTITSPADFDILRYVSSAAKWENKPGIFSLLAAHDWKIQAGDAGTISMAANSDNSITLPSAFPTAGVFAWVSIWPVSSWTNVFVQATGVTTTQINFHIAASGTQNYSVTWMAIGY